MGAINPRDAIIRAYSDRAAEYDAEANLSSCWNSASTRALQTIRANVDVGCGTGRALRELAAIARADTNFIGLEPAANMCRRAVSLLAKFSNVRFAQGRFEQLPLVSASVDYLFSILAFHWTTDLSASVAELARVLKPEGRLDLFFAGRHSGREFTAKTAPLFLKYMGSQRLHGAAAMRKHLTQESATALFQKRFSPDRLIVEETCDTYYDTLERHWNWWVPRTAGLLLNVPAEKRAECDGEIRRAIQTLETPRGIPYTIHVLHVHVDV